MLNILSTAYFKVLNVNEIVLGNAISKNKCKNISSRIFYQTFGSGCLSKRQTEEKIEL